MQTEKILEGVEVTAAELLENGKRRMTFPTLASSRLLHIFTARKGRRLHKFVTQPLGLVLIWDVPVHNRHCVCNLGSVPVPRSKVKWGGVAIHRSIKSF
jgi:hypothetical protein